MTDYIVSSGQTSSGITLNSGDTETVLSGGTANNTVVSSGGVETILSGGTANNTLVNNGGIENVSSGGTGSFTRIEGGVVNVYAGGVTYNDVVNNGNEVVFAGGTTSNTVLQYSGVETVSSGGSTSHTTLANTAVLNVSSGGSVFDSTLNNSAIINVFAGGAASGTIVTDGQEIVFGSTSGTILNGGREIISAGGTATGVVVNSGAAEYVNSGGTASNTVVSSGGTDYVNAGATVSGTQLLSGGTIDLVSLAYTSDGTVSLDQATDTLTVTEGSNTYAQTLSGTYTNEYFHLASGSDASTLVTVDSTPCYCPGTRLAVPGGEAAVEHLRIGDLVTTPDGPMPVKWIGRRSYSGRFARGNKAVLPIRISAGALADGVPCRDLWVSPKHAMLLDGVLIPAEVLVNGSSIVQIPEVEDIEYFHVELDRHGILVAEGALAESFVDDNSRGMFHNAHEHTALYPDARRTLALYCAPRQEDGRQVEAVRCRLAQRADPAAPSSYEGFGALRGSIDRVENGRVYGWAQHAERPEVPVCLEVLLNGTVVAQVLSNRRRADLWQAGLGSGCHAFEVTLPEVLQRHAHAHGMQTLRVRRSADGVELPNPSHSATGNEDRHDPAQGRAA